MKLLLTKWIIKELTLYFKICCLAFIRWWNLHLGQFGREYIYMRTSTRKRLYDPNGEVSSKNILCGFLIKRMVWKVFCTRTNCVTDWDICWHIMMQDMQTRYRDGFFIEELETKVPGNIIYQENANIRDLFDLSKFSCGKRVAGLTLMNGSILHPRKA